MSLEAPGILRRYAEAMAPAVTEGLTLLEPQGNPDKTLMVAQISILACLEKVGWQSSGLPNRQLDLEGRLGYVDPCEASKILMRDAFEDFFKITTLAKNTLAAATELSPVPVGQILLNSRDQLLLPARLSNKDKKDVLKAAKDFPKGLPAPGGIGRVPPYSGRALGVDHETRQSPYIRWHPVLEAWMKSCFSTRFGCPAAAVVVTEDGVNRSLLNLFWDKLVEKIYLD
ncbi:MAG TPA: hypothetical protein VLG37_01760 [Candidatus Saccharimonadales bacterium]|nr:hypothetical protein [Candidatus Saccharimonadales bacterium]